MESQAAYRVLGCVHAQEINAALAQAEPCDVQMEYLLWPASGIKKQRPPRRCSPWGMRRAAGNCFLYYSQFKLSYRRFTVR